MFRSGQKLLTATVSRILAQATYKNFVMSDDLAVLEKHCVTVCPRPRKILQKVTVVGAGTDIGKIACMLLKQHNVVKILAMYDEPQHKLVGTAHDISHIDTNTAVEAYQGKHYLRKALQSADLVLICGGKYIMPPLCTTTDKEIFYQNIMHVRSAAMAITAFCPDAFVAVQSPPVDANYALVKYVLKKAGVYNRRKVLGVNSISAMRANQLCASYTKSDPSDSLIPVVGGTTRCTRVPVLSSSKYYYCLGGDQKGFLTQLVREGDELICRVKGNCEQGHLSIGFATARCALNIMLGMFEKPAFIDSALVHQDDPGLCYGMKHCSTPVTIGKKGIITYHIPKLADDELQLLDDSKCDLEDLIALGRSYATGDEYRIHPEKVVKVLPPKCDECQPC